MQVTTGPVTPLLIINGPIAHDLKIESGTGCFGPGFRANATIGRSLRLVLINAGGAYPAVTDMRCHGSAQEFTFCVAEKEDHAVFHRSQGAWKPEHVEKGYTITTNTLTVMASLPPITVKDADHCDKEILETVIGAITAEGQEPLGLEWQYVLVLGATHAQCLADAGMSKDDIRDYIYANGVTTWGKYKKQYPGMKQPDWMRWTSDDMTSIHIFNSPKNVMVVVAGGECCYSQIIKCNKNGITKEIRL
jgi:hypothetical protein